MYQIRCTYTSLAPMMHDRFFNPEEMERGKQKKKSDTTWKDDLPLKLHSDKKGVFLPADNIRMMLVGNQYRPGAAKILGQFIETKRGTDYTSLCEGCIWIHGLEDDLKVYVKRDGKNIKWEIETDGVLNYDERSFPCKGGGRRLTRRPIIRMPWTMTFTIEVTDDRIQPEKVREFFDVAGFRCGAGAYGPTFGRCYVTEWEVVQAKKIAS